MTSKMQRTSITLFLLFTALSMNFGLLSMIGNEQSLTFVFGEIISNHFSTPSISKDEYGSITAEIESFPLENNLIWDIKEENGGIESKSGIAFDVSYSQTFPVENATQTLQLIPSGSIGVDWLREGYFQSPGDVAFDSSGLLYIADSGNHRIQKVNAITGAVSTTWGSLGSASGKFNSPGAIAINTSDIVFVADTGNHRIQVFSSIGTYLTSFGTQGSGNAQFQSPQGIAVNNSGFIYVVDSGNNRTQCFFPNGTYYNQFGSSGTSNGQFNNPRGIVTDSAGNLYIAERDNDRIQKFNPSGTHIASWGTNNPWGLDIDISGNVYVTNNTGAIVKINSTGSQKLVIGSSGSSLGEFSGPRGLAINGTGWL